MTDEGSTAGSDGRSDERSESRSDEQSDDRSGERSEEGYVVDVKRSARKASPEAGEWVNTEGSAREFPGRKAADSWARTCSTDDALVYVRDANPRDEAADGYLMALRRLSDPDREPRDHRDEEGAEQAEFARYRREREDQAGLERFEPR